MRHSRRNKYTQATQAAQKLATQAAQKLATQAAQKLATRARADSAASDRSVLLTSLTCDFCPKTYKTEIGLEKHIDIKHPKAG